jgi:transposase
MEIVFRHCCGLDVQKETIIASALTQGGGKVQKEVRTFRLSTPDLLLLHDWLADIGVTHVAMEGTAVHWKPVYHLLEGSFTLLLINMKPMKSVPGRRVGVEDCEWIADLLSYGLLKDNFVLPEPIRNLRDLLRYRKSLAEERIHEVNRLDKILESVNVPRTAGVISEAGFSRKAMLEGLFPRAAEEEVLSELAQGRLQDKLILLREVLQKSSFPAHQRFMLEQVLIHLDFLNDAFGQVSQEVQNRIAPFLEEAEPLKGEPEFEPRVLEGMDKRLLVICANCKKVRDSQEGWTPIENYLRENFATQFSHTVCPDCGKMLYPDLHEEEEEPSSSSPPSHERGPTTNPPRAGGDWEQRRAE